MCEHRLKDLICIISIIVSGIIILNGINHWPKTKIVEKCSKAPTQAEMEINFMKQVKDSCYDRGGIQTFKMIRYEDGTYHPEFKCKN